MFLCFNCQSLGVKRFIITYHISNSYQSLLNLARWWTRFLSFFFFFTGEVLSCLRKKILTSLWITASEICKCGSGINQSSFNVISSEKITQKQHSKSTSILFLISNRALIVGIYNRHTRINVVNIWRVTLWRSHDEVRSSVIFLPSVGCSLSMAPFASRRILSPCFASSLLERENLITNCYNKCFSPKHFVDTQSYISQTWWFGEEK